MDHALLKAIHVTAVGLSIAIFAARGYGMLAGARWPNAPAARRVPPVVDTVLLASAVWMAVQAGWGPIGQPWIGAKIAALIVYIALGVVALRPATPMPRRIAALAGAGLTVGYIVSVALTKRPAGFFSGGGLSHG